MTLLAIDQLSISLNHQQSLKPLVELDKLTVEAGSITAIVGESGSGKTLTALSVMGLLSEKSGFHIHGSIQCDNQSLLSGTNYNTHLADLRGNKIAMIFQEPMTSLNPLHTIGKQIAEIIDIHHPKQSDITARVRSLLHEVGIDKSLNTYPHELSGGQRQRVMIAMALANSPQLLIADEPTTALDIETQHHILRMILRLAREKSMAVLLITHNLNLVASMADYLYVMRHGKIVEHGVTKEIFNDPKEDYTRQMIHSMPKGTAPLVKETDHDLITVNNLSVKVPIKQGILRFNRDYLTILDNVSFSIKQGHSFGIIGESGSGKTTLIKAMLRLQHSTGSIIFDGIKIRSLSRSSLRYLRKNMQIVFQDPFASLNPRMSIYHIIAEGLKAHYPKLPLSEMQQRIEQVIQQVGLQTDMLDRYPHEFSGGQRQRIAIARAIILQPKLLILDEPTSALDVTVQLQIITLLQKLQQELGLTYLFISHDIAVIRAMSHQIGVLKDGKIIESGEAKTIMDNPQHVL